MYHIDSTVIIRNPSYPLNKLEQIDLESIIFMTNNAPMKRVIMCFRLALRT